MKLAISHATVATVDAHDTVIDDGIVLVAEGRIVAVDAAGSVSIPPDAEIINANGMLLAPGLVNSHTHLSNTLVRTLGADTPLLPWLDKMILPLYGNADPDEVRAGALLGALEAIRSGTTTVVENYYPRRDAKSTVDALAGAMLESGLRAVLVRQYHDKPGVVPDEFLELPDEVIEEYERIADTWDGRGGGRLTVGVGPTDPVFARPDQIQRVCEFARHRGLVIHSHVAECKPQVSLMLDEYGLEYVPFLDSLGVLGPTFTCAHAVWVSDSDIETLATRGAGVAHNPVSNMYLGSGVARVAEMRRAGVAVGLGTDGPGSNNTVDMIETMKTAALLQKAVHCDPAILNASEVLRMATIGGARLAGLDDQIGSIEVGKKADLMLVDLENSLACTPWFDAVAALVYSARSADVNTVIVDGEVVLRGGRLCRVDEQAAVDACRSEADRLIAQVPALGKLAHRRDASVS